MGSGAVPGSLIIDDDTGPFSFDNLGVGVGIRTGLAVGFHSWLLGLPMAPLDSPLFGPAFNAPNAATVRIRFLIQSAASATTHGLAIVVPRPSQSSTSNFPSSVNSGGGISFQRRVGTWEAQTWLAGGVLTDTYAPGSLVGSDDVLSVDVMVRPGDAPTLAPATLDVRSAIVGNQGAVVSRSFAFDGVQLPAMPGAETWYLGITQRSDAVIASSEVITAGRIDIDYAP